MNNNRNTDAHIVSMKPRRNAKWTRQHIKTCVERHKLDQAPYNGRILPH